MDRSPEPPSTTPEETKWLLVCSCFFMVWNILLNIEFAALRNEETKLVTGVSTI